MLGGIRCLVRFSNEVPWEFRDLASPAVTGGVGPSGTMLLDWMSVLLLCIILLGNLLQGKDLFGWPLLLWFTGCAFILWHGLQSADAMRVGASWLGATALGVAALHLARAPGPRKFLLVGFAVLLLPLSAKTFLQVGFEHPLTVSYYKEHKGEILARYGWQEGDAEARRFEGRLLRNDAKGVFTIANVFATVLIALTGLAMGFLSAFLWGWRSKGRTGPGILCALLVGLGLVCLILTQSRGGIGALFLAGFVVLISIFGQKKWRWYLGWRLLCLMPIGALPAVIWALGAMSGEDGLLLDPSLAVRGWHLEAARMIWMEAPLAGVGPGRFQEAYMVHKNPLSPENVTDSHNIFASWTASIGLGGVAWGLLLLWMIWKATALVGSTKDAAAPKPQRENWLPNSTFLLVTLGLLFLLQYLLQVQELGPQATLAWILGAISAILPAFLLWRHEIENGSMVRHAVLAGILALAIHAQMDTSMSDPMGAPLLMSILGLGAGWGHQIVSGNIEVSREAETTSRFWSTTNFPWVRCLNWIGCLGVGLVASIILIGFVWPLMNLISELKTAAREAMAGNARSAMSHLEQSVSWFPADPRPFYLMGVIKFQEASYLETKGNVPEAVTSCRAAIELWEKAERLGSRRAFLLRRKAEVATRLFGITDEEQWRDTALSYAQKAVNLDPYNRYGCIKMAQVLARLGFCEEAKSWYEKALRLDESLTVLPDLRFFPQERNRIETQLAELRKGCQI